MGWAKRAGDEARAASAARAQMLGRIKAVVDVQHLYRTGRHAGDRGSRYVLPDGFVVWEGACALNYAAVIARELRALGATVWTNDPRAGILVGPYLHRQQSAMAMGANLYLACHMNAGRGGYALVEYMRGSRADLLARLIVGELEAAISQITDARTTAIAPTDRGAVCVEGFMPGPAVILEPLFGDCPAHQGLLTLDGMARVGQAIVRGIVTWQARLLGG